MFDTVNHWLDKDSAGKLNLLAEIPPHLERISEVVNEDAYKVYGQLKNLKIGVFSEGVSIKGSLPKFFLNDNFQTLQRSDTERCIEELSDLLQLPIDKAKITRLDIAQNFIVDHEPNLYYSYLGNCQYFKRLPQENSLYYRTSSRTILFYDKIVEGKKSSYLPPSVWVNQNVLRYEYRLTQRIAKTLNMEVLRANDLYNEKVYIMLLNKYIQEYENIEKKQILKLNYSKMRSPKDFHKQMLALYYQRLGNELYQIIEEMRSNNQFDKKEYYSRLKKEIREYCNQPEIISKTDLLEELNKKVRAVKINMR